MATQKKMTKTEATKEPYLKGKNSIYLWSFISINLAILLSVIVGGKLAGSSIEEFWHRVSAKDGIIAASIPLLAIVLSGVLSDTAKARLVFWRWKDPLPGCRVFTELLGTDPRIDVPALQEKLGELPTEPQAQNALWYRLYEQQRTEVRIWEAHKIYLLTRDMATIAALFVVLFPIALTAATVAWKTAAIYISVLITQYLLTSSAARNYGVRFVLNVLSEESLAV
jgi:hypothetical protein